MHSLAYRLLRAAKHLLAADLTLYETEPPRVAADVCGKRKLCTSGKALQREVEHVRNAFEDARRTGDKDDTLALRERLEEAQEAQRQHTQACGRKTAKARVTRKTCGGCGRRVPAERQLPPFEGHKKDCTLVQKWNDKLPPKEIGGALLTQSEILKYSEDVKQQKMDFVVDALASWSDEEVDQYLKDLKVRLKQSHEEEGMTEADLELQCWMEALKDFNTYMKSARG